jgi:outer membrane protein assembly factor BamB
MLEKREFDKSDYFWRLSTTVTIVTGFFSLIIFTLLLVNYLQIKRLDPVNHELLTQMRQEYAVLPAKDPALAQRIRDLDLMTRKAFFTSQTHLNFGAILLAVFVSTFLIAFKNMIRWRPETPELGEIPTADKEFLAYEKSRELITWAGVGLLAGGLFFATFTKSALTAEMLEAKNPTEATETTEGGVPDEPGLAALVVPTWEEAGVNWPSFRGPGANGIAHFTTAPTEWDVEAGTNVLWKVEPPLPGNNSPVIWGDRLFITGASGEKREIYCYSVKDGSLIWSQTLSPLPGTPPELEVMEDTGFAACTMAVHGNRVFASFANGDIVSFDTDGNEAWGFNQGLPENHYGHSSSLLAYENLLFVQYDQSEDGKLLALDVDTGKETWSAPRDKISWASPILASTNVGHQLILCSEENADAFDPLTGKLIWSEECLGGEVAPSPAYSNGMVFVANEYAVASGITIGGTAEAVESEVIWQFDELLPEVASPIGDGERFYFGTAIGDLVALDAKTGEERWVEEMDEGFYSSPILVGDRIYLADLEGTMHIVKTGETFERIGAISMGEPVYATPAFMDGRIYIRTASQLYCIGSEEPSDTVADGAAVAPLELPTWEEAGMNWPSFRGPGANGIAHFTNAPTEWDVEAGTNVRWKIEPPLPGNNSPVIWGDRLYMTGATAEKREIYCYSVDDGSLIWSQTLSPFAGTPPELEVMEDTGFAACTMAVHGNRVFASFANGDIVSFDTDGNQAWGFNQGLPENHYGHSSSLLAYENLLYVQYDQSEDGKLLALDLNTGKEVWSAPRDKISWASPILASTTLGRQLILSSEENADAFDPLTGKLIWSEECLGGEVAPSPAYSNGMVFVANEYAVASGITIGGTAEAVESEVTWQFDELLPEVASPIGDGERFYFGTAIGDFVALDAKTGEERWVEEMDEGFYSSPILVGDRIYVADLEGTMHIVKTGETFARIGSISMGEPVYATPAFMDGRIYIRTESQLYCIEAS